MSCFYCEKQILSPSKDMDDVCHDCEIFLIKHGAIYHNDYENDEECNHSDEWIKKSIKKSIKKRK